MALNWGSTLFQESPYLPLTAFLGLSALLEMLLAKMGMTGGETPQERKEALERGILPERPAMRAVYRATVLIGLGGSLHLVRRWSTPPGGEADTAHTAQYVHIW